MIVQLHSAILEPSVRELLSYATSIHKVDSVYEGYLQSSEQFLFGVLTDNEIVGCIGVHIKQELCEIRHIAVSPEVRGQGIGSGMIDFIIQSGSFNVVVAETDKDAVDFYRKFGFIVTSLGEKYPGVERFLCELSAPTK